MTKETMLFECRGPAIAALQEALRTTRENSRRQHVLADLITANQPLRHAEKLQDKIKSLFKTYRDMDAPTRSALINARL